MSEKCPVCGAQGDDLQTMVVEDSHGHEYEVHEECFTKEQDNLIVRLSKLLS